MWRTITGLAALGLCLTALPAAGQGSAGGTPVRCDYRPAVVKQLASHYAEMPVGIGLAVNGGVVEVLASDSGASWTIIITMPDGMSCLMASGRGWETLSPAANVSLGPDS
ncbi:MAG: hypothetical protein EXQ87_13725 [Alphaproteobacteria bacterium]|nr:hypothetical protein [Alphaproteobacteria bacterium]